MRHDIIRRAGEYASTAATHSCRGKDGKRVDTHAATRRVSAGIVGCSPSELRILSVGSGGKNYGGRNKSTGISSPRLSSRQHAVSWPNHAVVATLNKRTAGSEDVLESAAIDADFQNAAIEARFSVVIIFELQPHARIGSTDRSRGDCNHWRCKLIVTGGC